MPEAFFPMEWKIMRKQICMNAAKNRAIACKSRWRHLLGRAASGPCAGKGRFTIRGKTCLCSGKKRGKTGKKGVPAKAAAGSCKEGQKIGRVCYYVEGELLREIPLYSDRQITKMTFWGTLEHIFGLWVH